MSLITKIKDYDKKIMAFEKKVEDIPGATQDVDSICPLKHTFVDGAYVREIFMPKGVLITSKIHKIKHVYFVLKGKCSVLTDEGEQLIEAPHYGITEAGTKRALYIHEDTVWVTVHVTEHKNLKKIEKDIIAKSFRAFNRFKKKQLTGGKP